MESSNNLKGAGLSLGGHETGISIPKSWSGKRTPPETTIKLADGTKLKARHLKHGQIVHRGKWLKLKVIINKRTGALSFKVCGRLPVAKRRENTNGEQIPITEGDTLKTSATD